MRSTSFLLLSIALVYIFNSPLASASPRELGQISSGASYLSTSDQIFQTEVDLEVRNHRRDLFWAYPGEVEKTWDFGADAKLYEGSDPSAEYEGRKASAYAARKFSSRALLGIEAGINSLLNKKQSWTANTFYGSVDLQLQVATAMDLNLRVTHDYVYQDLIQPGAVVSPLAALSEYADGDYHISERWRLPFHLKDRSLSDGNEIRETDVAAMYGISTGVPWIWVGFGGDYLTFKNYQPLYWSPWQFYSFGPRAEVVVPIALGLTGSIGLNLNRLTESALSPSNGYYGSAKLEYGDREKFNIALAYTQIVSSRDNGEWRLEQLGLELNAPF